MKKITSFLTLLLLAMCGIGASAQTTVTLDGTSMSGGTFYRYVNSADVAQSTTDQWCYKWVSSTTPAITLRVAPGTWGNLHSYNSGGFAMYRGMNGLTGGNTLPYTLSIADGYYITDIELQFHNAEAGQNITLSCNGSSATATSTTDDVTLAVSDIDAQSVTINLTADNNKGCLVSVFKVTYEAKDTDVESAIPTARQKGTDEAFVLQTKYGLVKTYNATAGNIVSNYKAGNEGTYEGLVDGTYTTYFHSAYGTVNSTEDHNLTFTLDNNQTVDEFYFYIKKRSQNNNNRPTAITVEGSNDGSTWTAIGNVTISGVSAATNDNVKDYFSEKLGTAGTSYSQIRFIVTSTNNNDKDNSGHVFFTASEWYILPANSVTDQYFTVAKALRGNMAPIGSNQTYVDNMASASQALLLFNASTADNPVWQAMSTNNMSSWWYASSNTEISNQNGNSLPTGPADAYAWAFYGNPTDGYKIHNKATGRYLGGRTTSGGTLTLVEEANAVLFVPEYSGSSDIRWKSKDYGYYVDRASGHPYAHTSGMVMNFRDLYNVSFTCSLNDVTAVLVGSESVSIGTDVVIASNANVTLSEPYFSITNYDGYSTLADALAAGAADDGVIHITAADNSTTYNYTYTQLDAANMSELGSGSGSQKGTSSGYILTPPTISGYAFYGAADGTNYSDLDLSDVINASNIVLLYVPILQSVSAANSSKAYTMNTPRGHLKAASADATQITAASGSADMTNALNQWTFVQVNGNYYLYNVGAQKFASFNTSGDHDLVTSLPASVASVASTYQTDTHPLVFQFTKGNTTNTLNMDGNCNVMINTYSTHDAGNVYQVLQVPGVTVTPDVHSVTFTCSSGKLSSVYVDGVEVALNTPVVLTSAATISSNADVSLNAIDSYNNLSTLAAAIADENFDGTVDVSIPVILTDITINLMRGSTIVKTVVVSNVPEDEVINVADEVGTPSFVTGFSRETITATDEDQTVNVTYTSTLPFTLSDDPTSDDAPAYLMTLRKHYTHGNATSSDFDYENNSYFWTFGGNEWDGITVYNRGNGYMSVGSAADNSVATFSTTPTAFTIKPNDNETNGFNLNIPGTNAYINLRDNNVSTWLSANANGEVGSCLKVYTPEQGVEILCSKLYPYFLNLGCVNGLSASDAQTIQLQFANVEMSYANYLLYKAAIEAKLIQPSEGYYVVKSAYSAFKDEQNVEKAMYYNTSNGTIGWTTVDGSAAQIMKLTAVEGASTYRLNAALGGTFLANKSGAMTSTETDGLTFEVTPAQPASVTLVYNANGGDDAAIHAGGHLSGKGTSGYLTGWNTTSEASMWRLVPISIPEVTLISPNNVIDGDEVFQSFAYGSNKQLPLNMGVYYISGLIGNYAHIETISSNEIKANQGYIIRGVKGAAIPMLPIESISEEPTNNILVGVTEQTTVNSGYILAYKNGDSEAKFYKIKSSGLTIPAYRSYIPGSSPVPGLEMIFGGIGEGEVTGIDEITTGVNGINDGAIYDLQGRRVTNATKGGIYIINGKKVIK